MPSSCSKNEQPKQAKVFNLNLQVPFLCFQYTLIKKKIYFLYVYSCFSCIYEYASFVCLVPTEIRRGCQVSETRVTEGCELPRRCWELNSDTLEEQLVLLSPEPSLQSIFISFLFLEQ